MSDVIGCELVGGETVAIHTRSTTGAERRMQFTPAEEGALRRCTSAAVLANALRCVGCRLLCFVLFILVSLFEK